VRKFLLVYRFLRCRPPGPSLQQPAGSAMKSFLSLLLTLVLLLAAIGTCAFLWYTSSATEFSRKGDEAQQHGR